MVCFTGDGGFYYHIAELETARRHNINAVIVVNNNSALNQEIRLNDAAYGGKQRGRAEEMWRFPDIDFTKVARAWLRRIRVTNPGELRGAQAGDCDGQARSCRWPRYVRHRQEAVVPTGAVDFHSFQRSRS